MKKHIFSITLLAILALSLNPLSVAAKSDFSGTWKLDAARSEGLPPGMEQLMTVTQTGDTIRLETLIKGTPQGEQKVPDSYTLDGQETDFKPGSAPNGKGRRTAKWNADGNGFEVVEKAEIETPDGANATIEATRKWSLAADGKTLTIEIKVKSPNGEQTSRRVFIKQ